MGAPVFRPAQRAKGPRQHTATNARSHPRLGTPASAGTAGQRPAHNTPPPTPDHTHGLERRLQPAQRAKGPRTTHRHQPQIAPTAWNAGFSRHSPPQAGGGTDRIRRDGSNARATAPGVTKNRPRPCGPLCRLKPAFQAGPATPDVPPPVPDGAAPEPAEEGAIFHALLDAGVEAKLAYTAEKRMHAMTSETIAEHTQPILVEVRQLAAQVRDLTATVATPPRAHRRHPGAQGGRRRTRPQAGRAGSPDAADDWRLRPPGHRPHRGLRHPVHQVGRRPFPRRRAAGLRTRDITWDANRRWAPCCSVSLSCGIDPDRTAKTRSPVA